MHPYFLYSCLFCSTLHFMAKIRFCDRKQSFVRLDVIKHFDVLLHFLTEKRRHFDCAVTLFRLRACDNVTPFGTVESLADCDCLLLKINISRRERKQFCFCQVKTKKIFFYNRKGTTELSSLVPSQLPTNTYCILQFKFIIPKQTIVSLTYSLNFNRILFSNIVLL